MSRVSASTGSSGGRAHRASRSASASSTARRGSTTGYGGGEDVPRRILLTCGAVARGRT
ncbi:hypothetical protein [Corynebacterium bovis]|uniref:hypothetical protein n=1 Tax=Corynebacterium bovis TaxID=36808 RepID=UPI00163B1531|nr:hypothetical protein [Corynebacterium bovis]